MSVHTRTHDNIQVITIDRPDRRNAVDADTALALHAACLAFDADDALSAAVLTGAGGNFCAGADLKAIAGGTANPLHADGDLAPMGPSRLRLGKPVIAAVEGFAVAGGLELALWCDMRVAARGATFGVFCRRFGVPLIDLGTVRLPRLIGHSRAADMILTGRPVGAEEALQFGLANRLVEDGKALSAALALAREIVAFPQVCLRNDRASMLDQWGMDETAAWQSEIRFGIETMRSGETLGGAGRFADGAGRHGRFPGDDSAD